MCRLSVDWVVLFTGLTGRIITISWSLSKGQSVQSKSPTAIFPCLILCLGICICKVQQSSHIVVVQYLPRWAAPLFRVLRWALALSLASHRHDVPTSFSSDHHKVLHGQVECTIIWGRFQHTDECSLRGLITAGILLSVNVHCYFEGELFRILQSFPLLPRFSLLARNVNQPFLWLVTPNIHSDILIGWSCSAYWQPQTLYWQVIYYSWNQPTCCKDFLFFFFLNSRHVPITDQKRKKLSGFLENLVRLEHILTIVAGFVSSSSSFF